MRLDPRRRTVTLPVAVGLDLGGIAKGWLADRVADELQTIGPTLADLGGDVAVRGAPPEADAWAIDVEGPAGSLLGVVKLAGGLGIATSGVTRRRWHTADGLRHHLIDPRTGAPALTDLVSVTVTAPTVAAAEVAAKAVLLLGSDLGRAALAQAPELAGLLVRRDGHAEVIGNLCWTPAQTVEAATEVQR